MVVCAAISLVSHRASCADLTVPSMYGTVQEAIDAANAGDVILIAPGTYAGPFFISGKELTLRGVAGPLETILTGEGTHRVLTLQGVPAGTVIEGLTIADGAHSDATGSGGVMSIGSSATIRNCRFVRNRSLGCYPASAWGAAAYYGEGGSALLENCAFVENSAAYSGSGVYQYLSGSIAIRNCDFARNATGGHGVGGSPCNYTDNGTIHLQNEGGTVSAVIEGCRFSETIGYGAMAISCWSPGGVIGLNVSNCRFVLPIVVPSPNVPYEPIPTVAVSGYSYSSGNSATLALNEYCGYVQSHFFPAGYALSVIDGTSMEGCPSPDVDGDGLTTGKELAAVLSSWGSVGTGLPQDFDMDGLVDGNDLSRVLSGWQ
jgi:hypothetical protein